MSEFTLVQLRYFRLVAETGSFSAAAEELHVSATAIASAITALERSVGVQLCVRRRAHGIQLTTSGRLLLQRAHRLLAEAEEARLELSGGTGELVGPLRVGCYSTMAPTVLPALVETCERRHPKVSVELSVRSQELLLEDLFEGRLDCVVLYDIALPEGLTKVGLYRAPIHVLLSAEHRLAGRESVRLDELEHEPLIFFESTPAGPHTLRVFDRLALTPRIAHRTTEYELVRSLVARGLGYSLMIHQPALGITYEGRELRRVAIDPPLPLETAVLVWPVDVVPSPRTLELVRIARELFDVDDAQGAAPSH